MEIKKLYFTLDEAAQLLSASIDAILQSAHDGRIALCVNPFGYQFSAIEYNDENNLTMKPVRFEGLKLSQATIRELIDNKGSLVLVREPKSMDEISLVPTLYSENENSRTVLYSIDQEKMQLTLSDLVITADEIERLTQPAQANHSPADTVQADQPKPQTNNDSPSKTAKKVIGLFMHDLMDRSPKYKAGDKPNKSAIRDYLLELAQKHHIDSYGLSKADERILSEALSYLEEQRTD